jgi:hypothetical protein
MSDSDGAPAGTWQGTVSALVLAGIVTGVVLAIAACCSRGCGEFFYPRQLFVRKRWAVRAPGAASAGVSAQGADAGEGGGLGGPAAPAGPGGCGAPAPAPRPAKLAASTERKSNAAYEAAAPTHLFLAPFIRPWVELLAGWRSYAGACASRSGWALLRGQHSLLAHVSLDAHMTDVYLQLCLLFAAACFLLAIPVAIVNATSGGPYDDALYSLATSRIAQGSSRRWVHSGALAAATLLLLALIHVGYREYERQRLRWLAVLSPARFTVLVTGMPTHGETPARLRGRQLMGGLKVSACR